MPMSRVTNQVSLLICLFPWSGFFAGFWFAACEGDRPCQFDQQIRLTRCLRTEPELLAGPASLEQARNLFGANDQYGRFVPFLA